MTEAPTFGQTKRQVRQASLVSESEAPAEISFSASVDRIIFKNDSNGYAIVRVCPDSKDA